MNWRRVARWGGTAAAVALAILLLLPSLNVFDAQLSAYGSADDDASFAVNGLRQEGYEIASLKLGPSALSSLDLGRVDAIYLSIGVDRGYTGAELDALMDFVERGGTAIVLDDTGAAGSLLDRVGVRRGPLLLSTEGTDPSRVPVTIDGIPVDMQEPASLEVEGEDVEVIGRSSNLTAKDADGDGEIDASDPTCNPGCAVAVEATIGEGNVIIIGDPTFATNRYAQRTNAIQLLRHLADEAATGGQRALVIVDESRHVAGPSEIALSIFRTPIQPLALGGVVPWVVGGLSLAATAYGVYGRDEETWVDHDPGLEEPYLPPDALGTDEPPDGGEPP